jgi:hypothetical protein
MSLGPEMSRLLRDKSLSLGAVANLSNLISSWRLAAKEHISHIISFDTHPVQAFGLCTLLLLVPTVYILRQMASDQPATPQRKGVTYGMFHPAFSGTL